MESLACSNTKRNCGRRSKDPCNFLEKFQGDEIGIEKGV